jgi:hypothetical protein
MGSFRTTITVPQDLKERMDAVQVDVNWSAVAARAFEEKLVEIASKKEKREMSDFIRVFGPDPGNKNQQTYQHLHRGMICKVVPVYAEEKDGKFYSCTPNYPRAKLISYRLIDSNGVQYSCGNRHELERHGFLHEEKKGKIGFVLADGKTKQEWDLVDEQEDKDKNR